MYNYCVYNKSTRLWIKLLNLRKPDDRIDINKTKVNEQIKAPKQLVKLDGNQTN